MGAHHGGGRPEDEARAGRLRVIEAVHTHAVDRKQGTAVRRVENGEGEGAGQVIEKPLPVLAKGEPQGRGSALRLLRDRTSVVQGKRVSVRVHPGGRRSIKIEI